MKDAQKSVLLPYEKYLRLLAGNSTKVQKEEVRELQPKEVRELQPDEISIEDTDGLTIEDILDTVPQRYRKRIESILNYISRDPRHALNWNVRGELIYKDTAVSDSHITDL